MTVAKAEFHGDPNIGLFGFATDKYVIVPDSNLDTSILGVPAVYTTVAQTELVGLFMVGNSNGIILPHIINAREEERIKIGFKNIKKKVNILKLDSSKTCIGNLILCNDNGAVISPLLEKYKESISRCLKVPVVVGNITELDIVGSLCVVTNKGFLLTIEGKDPDFEFLKTNLKVGGDIGTVNFGGVFIRSGIIANSNGALIGKFTTGPEIARIEEALGFLED